MSTQILAQMAPGATDAAIRSAAALLNTFGGGDVVLPVGTSTILSPLPIYPGVGYIGTKNKLTFGAGIPDSVWTVAGGTLLQGDGTFDCFQANTSSQGSESPYNLISGVKICDLAIDNFVNGINIGGHNNGGLDKGSVLSNLLISNCSGWGVQLVNFMHIKVEGVWARLCQNTARFASDMTTLSPGNSVIRDVYGIVPADGRDNRLCKGIVFENGATILNELYCERIQFNAFNRSLLTAAATMANASTTIGVPDGTKFAVGMQVTVSATANGFTANQIYIVLSIAGNNITLGNSKTASAISATGNTPVNILSYGFAGVEICRAVGGSSTVAASSFIGVDVEGVATVGVYTENCIINMVVDELPSTKFADICGRTSSGKVASLNSAIVDFDSSSTVEFTGIRNTTNAPVQRTGYGLSRNVGGVPNGTYGLYMSPGGLINGGDIQYRASGLLYPAAGMGQTHRERDSSLTLSAGWLGTIAFNGPTGQTFTLTTLTDDSSTANSSLLGGIFEIENYSANNLTVATDGTQLFNAVAAKTSLTVAPQTTLKVAGRKLANGTLFWKAVSEAHA